MNATFVGTMGPPTFDPATGTRQAKGSVYCFASASNAVVYDTLYTASGTSLVPGENPFCFPLF